MKPGSRIWPLGPQPGRIVAAFVEHMGMHGQERAELERLGASLTLAMAPRLLCMRPGRLFAAALIVPVVGELAPHPVGRLLCLVRLHDGSVRYVSLPRSPLGHDDGTCRNVALRLEAVLAHKDVSSIGRRPRPWSGDHTQLLSMAADDSPQADFGVESRIFPEVATLSKLLSQAVLAFCRRGPAAFSFPRPLSCTVRQDRGDAGTWSLSVGVGRTSVDSVSGALLVDTERWVRIAWALLPVPSGIACLDDGVLPSGRPLRVEGLRGESISRLWKDYIYDGLRQARSAALMRAYAEFIRPMDEELLSMLEMVAPGNRGAVHGWLLAGADRLLQIHRRQALKACPVLVGHSAAASARFLDSRRAGWVCGRQDEDPGRPVLQAIDEGAPLAGTLCEHYGISRPVLRSLGGVSAARMESQVDLALLRQASPFLSADSLPSGGAEEREKAWLRLWQVLEALARQTREDGYQAYIPLTLGEALQRERPFWKDARHFPSLGSEHHAIHDMMSSFATRVMGPAVVDALRRNGADILPHADMVALLHRSSYGRRSIVARTLGVRRLATLVDCSERWHRNQDRIGTSLILAADERRWPALFDPVRVDACDDDGGGVVTATVLTSSAMLAEEGEAMRHCVASYIPACLDGVCHIVSLRDADGGRLSTLEIVERADDKGGADRLRIVQNQGPGNGEPPMQARAAAAVLLRLLHDEPARVHWDSLERAAARRREEVGRDAFSLLCHDIGYDLDSPAGRDAALQGYRFLLQPQHRGLPYDEWVRATGLDGMLDEQFRPRLGRQADARTDGSSRG